MSVTRIGVISDTHYTPQEHSSSHSHAEFPFKNIRVAFGKVSLIIHCGDIVSMDMLNVLSEIAPLEAVSGNSDSTETCRHIPKRKLISVSGLNIGIIHGFGTGDGFPEKLFEVFEAYPRGKSLPSSKKSVIDGGGKLDALVFGHTHMPFNERLNGILCFNPGSPVKPRGGFGPSVGILSISPRHLISGEIINI